MASKAQDMELHIGDIPVFPFMAQEIDSSISGRTAMYRHVLQMTGQDTALATSLAQKDTRERAKAVSRACRPFQYNVSRFIRDYQSMGPEWLSKLDDFIQELDKRVVIDIENAVHKPILDGIQTIANTICDKLKMARFNKLFDENLKIRYTGSLYSGLRVGRPYEADILLEIDEEKAPHIQQHLLNGIALIKNFASELHLENWILHCTTRHGAGVCIKMEYKEDTDSEVGVGVLIDIIPIIRLAEPISTAAIKEDTKSFIETLQGKFDYTNYMLCFKFKSTLWQVADINMDTGFLETQILANLPKDVKIGYRVAKYLLQSLAASPISMSDESEGSCDSDEVSPEERVYCENEENQLYGYSSVIRSHILQVFLLHLLIQTHGTAHEGQLTRGALTLCLLDMLYVLMTQINDTSIWLGSQTLRTFNPILKDKPKYVKILPDEYQDCEYNVVHFGILPALQKLSCKLLKDVSLGKHTALDYPLVHPPNAIFSDILLYDDVLLDWYEPTEKDCKLWTCETHNRSHQNSNLKFTGFCRGSSPEEFARACNSLEDP